MDAASISGEESGVVCMLEVEWRRLVHLLGRSVVRVDDRGSCWVDCRDDLAFLRRLRTRPQGGRLQCCC